MFQRRLLILAKCATAEVFNTTKRYFATGRNRSPRVVDAALLENRVLFSASPIADAPIDDLTDDGAFAGLHDFDAAAAVSPAAEDAQRLDVEVLVSDDLEPTSPAQTPSRELVFVDLTADDAQVLVDDLVNAAVDGREFEVILLDSSQDGVDRITQILADRTDVDAIHIISHGDGQGIQLGNTRLDVNTARGYASDIASWADSLAVDADLLIYGCDLASTTEGRELVDSIGALCDCDVSASDDATGSVARGGDWNLEYDYGVIDTSVAFSLQTQASWQGLLANYTVSNTNDSGGGSLRQAILDANANPGSDNIVFNIGTGDSGYVDPTPGSPGSGDEYWTIQPTTVLDAITEAVVIDATTQPGFGGAPVIELDGSIATGIDENGFTIETSGVTIRGFAINHFLDDAIEIDVHGGGHTIVGNYLGTDITGLVSGHGNRYGITVKSDGNTIGGTTVADRNVIAGNRSNSDSYGIGFWQDADNNVVHGNYIGVGVDGTTEIGNEEGISFNGTNHANVIGGENVGEGNIIAFSDGAGIAVLSSSADGNSFLGNSIHSNTGLGIDLAGDGMTANDALASMDSDTGANNRQNFAILTSAGTDGSGRVAVAGSLTTTANTAARLEFFVTDVAAAGNGEGKTYLGHTTVNTNVNGDARFVTSFDKVLAAGQYIASTTTVITASGTYGSTSEFSANVQVNSALIVDSVLDEVDGTTTSVAALLAGRGADGFISLREAIIASNNTAGAETIYVLAGTYTLTRAGAGEDAASTGDLDVSDALTIVGDGNESTIIQAGTTSSNGIDRVFDINAAVNVAIADVTIRHGNLPTLLGGGIQNAGDLVLDGVALAENTSMAGGGVYNASTSSLTVTGGRITGNSSEDGGGIWINSSTAGATVVGVTVSGNTVTKFGGGIYNEASPLLIVGSAFTGNSALEGGAIYNAGSSLTQTLTNVTLSGNTAINLGGAVMNNAGNLTATNLTITGNSSAIGSGINRQAGTLSLRNTIVAGNLGAADVNGTFTSLGNNLIGNSGSSSGWIGSDLIGVAPTLGALADNGGPTKTHALLHGSRGIDEGNSTGAPVIDQRGFARGGYVDIGAYEIPGVTAAALWLSTKDDVVSSGAPGLSAWTDGEFLEFGGPDLAFEPTGTNGTFSSVVNFNSFFDGANVELGSQHYVTKDITVGSGPHTFDLFAGDVLFSFEIDQTTGATTYFNQDLHVFRPGALGDYSSGTISVLLEGLADFRIRAITLVEHDTWVGDVLLKAGEFLYFDNNYAAEIRHFEATGVGVGTTAGTKQTFLNSTGAYNVIHDFVGMELIEVETTIGGKTLAAGTILVSAAEPDVVGNNSLAVDDSDIFALTVSQTIMGSATSSATAAMFMDGSVVGLTDSGEDIVSLSFYTVVTDAGNAAPTISLPATTLNYTEGDGAVVIDATATTSDSDSVNLATGTLTVDFTANGTANDRLAINNEGNGFGQIGLSGSNVTYEGTTIGTFAGGADGSTPLVITFNASSTPAAAQGLLRNITFENVADDPSELARTMRFVLTDGDGGTSNIATLSTTLTAVNDAPSFATTNSTPTFTENGGMVGLFSGTSVDVLEAGDLVDTLIVTVAALADGSAEILVVDDQNIELTHLNSETTATSGYDVGVTLSGTTATVTITKSGGYTAAAAAAIVDGLAYNNTSEDPQGAARLVTLFSIKDDGGTANSGADTTSIAIASLVTIQPENDAPVAADDPSSLPFEVLAQNPVGYWRLGESSGTTATNLGSLVADGTYNGPALGAAGYPSSGSDTAASFDGVNDNVNLGTFDVSGTGLTLSAWINAADFDVTDARIISKAESTGASAEEDHWWMLSTQSSGADTVLRFRVKAGGTTTTLVASSGVMTAGEWYFASATYDASTGSMKIYLNGVEVGSRSHTVGGAVSTDATRTVMIGANPNNYGHFDGRIDEVAVYDKALSQSELQAMFHSGSGGYVVNEDAALVVSTANGVLANDTDVENDTLTANLVTGPANAASFTLNPDGSFDYTPTANFNGTDSFVYRSFDGTSYSSNATAMIFVRPVNDAPVVDNGGSPSLTAITENDLNNGGNTVAQILASDGGVDPILDVDSGAVEGIAISGLGGSNGIWQFNTGSGWTDAGAVSATSALLLRATDSLRFQPDGTDGDLGTVLFQAWDQTTGTAGTKVDSSSSGGTTAFSNQVEVAILNVTGVNDAPIVDLNGADGGGNDFSVTFTQGGGAVNVTDSDATISDVDHTTYQGMGINLKTGFADGASEKITIAGYTFSYGVSEIVVRTVGSTDFYIDFDGTGFTITRDVSGTMPHADLQSLLLGVTYENTLSDPTSGDRTIEIAAEDAGLLNGSYSTSTITVANVNDAPVNSVPAGQSMAEDGTLIFSTGNGNAIGVSDADAGMDPLRVQLNVDLGGLLTLFQTTGLTFSVGDGTADADMTFTGTAAAINAALDGIAFVSTSEFSGLVNLTIITNDQGNNGVDPGNTGDGSSEEDTDVVAITVSPVNDAPVATTTGSTLAYVENDGAVVIDSGVTVTDVDNGNLSSATVSITGALIAGEDELAFSNQLGIVGSYNSGTGILSLSGTSSVANYQTALRSVTYQNTSEIPDPSTRTISFFVDDGVDSSAAATRSISIASINDDPTNAGSLPTDVVVTEDVSTFIDLSAVDFNDVDHNNQLVNVILSTSTGGRLYAGTDMDVTVSGSGTGFMFLQGGINDLNAFFNSATRISYQHGTPHTNGDNADTISVEINDAGNTGAGGSGTILLGTANVDITPVNDNPVISLPGPVVNYLENSGAVVIDAAATASDVDGLDFDTGTLIVDLTANGTANDRLAVRDQGIGVGNIRVSGNNIGYHFAAPSTLIGTFAGGTDGLTPLVITLNANADAAAVQALIRNITFENVIDTPSEVARTVRIVLTDGDSGTSNTATKSINVAAVNDLPTITPIADQTPLEDMATGTIAFTIGDVETATGSLIVTATSNNQTLIPGGNITLGGSGASRTIDVLPGLNQFGGPATITVMVDDGTSITATTFDVTITADNDAPTNTVPGRQTVVEETQSAIAGISVADVDAATGNITTRLSVSNGVLNVTLSGVASISAGVNNTNDLTIFGTVDDVNATLASLLYTGNVDVTGIAADSLTVATDDAGNMGAGGAQQDVDIIPIDVTAVNDVPLSSVPGLQVTNEDTPLTFSIANGNAIRVSDVDASNFPVIVTLTATNGTLTLSSTADLTFGDGDGTSDATMTIVAPIADINRAMNGLRFDPVAEFYGNATIQITVDDQGNVGSGGALVDLDLIHISVNPINDVPLPTADTYRVDGSQTLAVGSPGILANDVDVDGDSLVAVLIDGPAGGTLSLASDGSFVYTPDIGFSGIDSFTYVASDGVTTSAAATVTIDVQSTIGLPPTTALDNPSRQDPKPDESEDDDVLPEVSAPTTARPIDESERPTPPRRSVPNSDSPAPTNRLALAQSASVVTKEATVEALVAEAAPRVATEIRFADRPRNPKAAILRTNSGDAFETNSLFAALDSVADDVANDGYLTRLIAGTSVVATGTLSTAFVLWTARASYLVTVLSSSLPAWASIDPIPVLDAQALAREEKPQAVLNSESLVDIAERRARADRRA